MCSHSLLPYEQRLRQTIYTLIVLWCYLSPFPEAKNVDLLSGINRVRYAKKDNSTSYTKDMTYGLPNNSLSGL
ncbi:MAG: hypothetical protein RQM90_01805 [Methanoculleus sp.]